MNVLIYGAGNRISLSIAMFLSKSGSNAILADTGKYARAFFSRYCKKKYVFRGPDNDGGTEAFISDLHDCIKQEGIELIVPTSDNALFHLISAKDSIPKGVKVLFPLDYEKISYVMNKKNIPSICARSGIDTISTYLLDNDFRISDIEKIGPPYALKLEYGISGDGFIKVDSLKKLEKELGRIRDRGLGKRYLLQKYISGPVYGAGGIFENNTLKHFFSYKYIRRYPPLAGVSTICVVDFQDSIKTAMTKVLITLQWEGFCQMDFIVEDKSRIPYLTDINPVHWYSVPDSLSEELNCLAYYINGGKKGELKKNKQEGFYSTISLAGELQRIATGGVFRKSIPAGITYWQCLQGLKYSDFYWDPLPLLLVPFLNIKKAHGKKLWVNAKGEKR